MMASPNCLKKEPCDVKVISERFETKGPSELLIWAREKFPNLAFACSFGAEDMVLLDLFAKLELPGKVFYLDTGRLHQETYDLVDLARERYGLRIEAYAPRSITVSNLISLKGPNSFYRSVEDRKECCFIRKVEPLNRALAGVDAWITGQRRDQSVTRLALAKVELDADHGDILKLNPLADWTIEQVWQYVHDNDVPYNKLHDKGFPSIGCAPCTRAIQSGEDLRAGRWWWEAPENKECGLHFRNLGENI